MKKIKSNLKEWWYWKGRHKIGEWLFLTFLSAFLIGIIPFAIWSYDYECDNYNKATGRETKIVALNCYVKIDGEWWLVKQVRKEQ